MLARCAIRAFSRRMLGVISGSIRPFCCAERREAIGPSAEMVKEGAWWGKGRW